MLGGVPCTDGEMYGGGGHYEGLVRLVHAWWSFMYRWRDVWGGGDSLCGIGMVSACLVEFHVQIH